jgi:hypothetical protein
VQLLVAASLAVTSPAAAFHTVFDFPVDRFLIRYFASPSDEFDFVTGLWTTLDGTVFVADGRLHLASPGRHVPGGFNIVPGRELDISQAYYARTITRGLGDCDAETWWDRVPLKPGDFNHFTLFGFGSATDPFAEFEFAGLSLNHPLPEGGAAPTWAVTQSRFRLLDGQTVPLQSESIVLAPGDVTGQIVLGIAYADASRTVTTRVSVDGGMTFTSPFAPVAFFEKTSQAVFVVGADPLALVEPPPLCRSDSRISRFRVRIDDRKRTLTLRGVVDESGDLDPTRDGLQLRVEDGVTQAVLLDATRARALPPAVAGCGPGDGWRRTGGVYVYRNRSGALPPACQADSAGGLRRVAFRPSRKGGRIRVTVRSAEPLTVQGAVRAIVAPGSGPPYFGRTGCGVGGARCAPRRRGVVLCTD